MHIKHIIPYLKDRLDLDIVRYYNLDTSLYRLDDKGISHILYLRGDDKERLLYCYIEFFNVYGFLVKLNDDYAGKGFISQYCYDLVKQEEEKKDIDFALSRKELEGIFGMKDIPYDVVKRKLERFLKIAQEKQRSEHINELIDTAFKNFSMKNTEDTILSEEQQAELIEELSKQVLPFMSANLKQVKGD